MKACDLVKGSVVELDGDVCVAERLSVQTPSARGAATLYKVRFRNVRTRAKVDRTFKGDDAVTEADFETRAVEFSYRDGDTFVFLDQSDFSSIELNLGELEDIVPYLTDGQEGIKALLRDGKVLALQLPDSVTLEIAECAPAMRGASVTARTKTAVLETGHKLQVPEYMAPGEKIRVDTRTGEFVQRA
ncbi:MAG: elongation factor P-like protein YeiP [Kiritimatiellae bacterium]|nr:elongation factor P-like protein YeiP [Kiritimatiellia bacterium]